MNGVARWFDSRGEVPLVAPPGLREYVPILDDVDRPGLDFSDSAVGGVSFALEYCDLRGRVSTRTIRCMAMNAEHPAALKAWCRVRGEMRTFQIDRIISIVDLRTGAMLSGEAHVDMLAPYLPGSRDPEIRALKNLQEVTRDGVFALLHLAMPDGVLPTKSREIVLEYLAAEAWDCRRLLPHADLLALWVDNLAPHRRAVADGIDRLLADKDKFARLLPWLLKVARSQATFAAQEESIRDLIAEVRGHYRRRQTGLPAQAVGAWG